MCTSNQELSLYQLILCGLLFQMHNKLTEVQRDRRLARKLERQYCEDIFESFLYGRNTLTLIGLLIPTLVLKISSLNQY